MVKFAPDAVARANLELRLRHEQMAEAPGYDPLRRLFDPAFTDPLWYYEYSKISPEIPGKLHAKQLEALLNPSAHRWLFWGNQAGKTTIACIDVVLHALGRHPLQLAGVHAQAPWTAWASALSWDLWERILLPELLTWIPIDRIISAPEPNKHSNNRDILVRADNGTISRITGKSAEQGAKMYQSARVHQILFDEEHPEEIYNEMLPRLVRFGGITIAPATPLLGMTWMYAKVYEPLKNGDLEVAKRHWFSHAGMADNPAISPEQIANLSLELAHIPSQLISRLFGLFTKPEGVVYGAWDSVKNVIELEGEDLADTIASGQAYAHVDFGKWRFAFAFGVVIPDGTLIMIDEVFSQDESSDIRATRINKVLQKYGVKELLMWGDCAAKDELAELNNSFARLEAPWFCLPVEMINKSRPNGITRVGNLIQRRALKMRSTVGQGVTWFLGRKSNSSGRPMHTSRWLWELLNWAHKKMPDGKTQIDDPDDDTADGADMMDGLRYLALQWLGPLVLDIPTAHDLTLQGRMQQDLKRLQAQNGPAVAEDWYGEVLQQ